MKRLYQVLLEATVYVVAEDEDEAEQIALDGTHRSEIIFDPSAREIQKENQIDGGWNNAIPFGDTEFVGDKTCPEVLMDILEKQEIERFKQEKKELEEKNQMKLFEEKP